ncbi:MAG: hypothetical protein FWH37_09370 [Candidatus Bathyarchaeota archaeon]|nr:hypothetical protein [Candidatus Termiticorpusculum sp.]
MKRGLRLCLIVFLIGLSLLVVTVMRTNSIPRVMNFGNEEEGATSGWIMYSDFLMFHRDFSVTIRANNTVSVYILDEGAVKQWNNSKTLDATWSYENVVQGVFNEQTNRRGGYTILVHLPENSTTAVKVTLSFSGFEKDLFILSIAIIGTGILSTAALLLTTLKNKPDKGDKRIDKGGRGDKSSRTIVIALGVICSILAVSTIAAFTLNPAQDMLDKKDKTINELNNQIATLTNQVAALLMLQNKTEEQTIEITDLKEQITTMNERYEEAQQHLNLTVTEVVYNNTLHQETGKTTTIFYDKVDYAGYILVESESNSTSTYVQIKYTYTYDNQDLEFLYKVDLGTAKKSIVLPILPATVEVIIGNANDKVNTEEKAEIFDNKANIIAKIFY